MHGQWLRGLAENPATPTEILIRLLEPDTRTAWETLCSTRDLPQAVIDAILAHPNPLVTQYFAKNRKVDPGQLARLLDNPHPRASYWLVDGIRKQGRQMPDDLISRLLRHEDPLMTRVEWFEELRIVLSGEAMRRAARHTDPLMREWSCGSWRILPAETRASLLSDPEAAVRSAAEEVEAWEQKVYQPADFPTRQCHATWHILLHCRMSRTLIDQVLERADESELGALAYNVHTPAEVIGQLIAHPSPEVRGYVAAREDLSEQQVRQLAADPDKGVRTIVSYQAALPETIRATLDVTVPDADTMRWRVLLWDTDLHQSITRASSVSPLLRRAAAGDHRLPVELAHRLAHDPDLGVRIQLCLHHPNAPAEALLEAYLAYTGPDRARLADHPNFPDNGLASLADYPDPQVRLLISRDTTAQPDLIDRLSRDPDLHVRQAIARCPRLPVRRIAELLHDPDVAQHAAANPALPVQLMYELMDARSDTNAGVGSTVDTAR